MTGTAMVKEATFAGQAVGCAADLAVGHEQFPEPVSSLAIVTETAIWNRRHFAQWQAINDIAPWSNIKTRIAVADMDVAKFFGAAPL